MAEKKSNLLTLFITFFKLGLFTFGGGYAMISLIQHEVVENHKWITNDDMMNIIVIAESTPGVLAVNTATFVGYRVGGVLGSVLATLGVTLPSVMIIVTISFFLDAFKNVKVIAYAFSGIKAGIIVLVMNSIKKLNKANPKNILTYSILTSSVVLSSFLKVKAIYIIVMSLCFGILLEFAKTVLKKGGEKNK